MTRRTRGLVGTFLFIGVLIAYPVAVATLFGEWLATLPAWASILMLALFGGLWFFPAALIVRWMSAPDRP